MSKPYSWPEIKNFLAKELNSAKHIMTFGTIGSCNIEHDIDIIITKKPSSKSSAFYKEVHDLFNGVDTYLQKKHKAKMIRTSRFSDEEETKYIANFQDKDLVFQVLTYVSFKQIEMHWADLGLPQKEIKDILEKGYSCIIGKNQDLFISSFKAYKAEHLFIRLNDSDRINSHFPRTFFIKRMNVLFDYILRKRLGKKPLIAKTEKEVRAVFYKICDILDDFR